VGESIQSSFRVHSFYHRSLVANESQAKDISATPVPLSNAAFPQSNIHLVSAAAEDSQINERKHEFSPALRWVSLENQAKTLRKEWE
jgi:hypothetical protein